MLISKVNKFLTSNVSTLRNTSISRKNPAIFQVFDRPGKLIIMEVKFAEVKKTNFFFNTVFIVKHQPVRTRRIFSVASLFREENTSDLFLNMILISSRNTILGNTFFFLFSSVQGQFD